MGLYLTPDTSDGTYLCRRLRFRAELAGFITGALLPFVEADAWEAFGTMTPAEAAAFSLESLNYYLDAGDRCMTGELWVGITADYPDGVLPFDGTQYLRTDYPSLYALIDAAFIDDADHFTLHEAAGRALVIAGVGGGGLTPRAVGDTFGVETVTLVEADIPSHSHSVIDPGSVVVEAGIGAIALADPGLPTVTGDTGGGGAHENMQPSFAVKVGVWAT